MKNRSFLTAYLLAYSSITKQIGKILEHKIDSLEELKKDELEKEFKGELEQ
jgi:hypothetical protein